MTTPVNLTNNRYYQRFVPRVSKKEETIVEIKKTFKAIKTASKASEPDSLAKLFDTLSEQLSQPAFVMLSKAEKNKLFEQEKKTLAVINTVENLKIEELEESLGRYLIKAHVKKIDRESRKRLEMSYKDRTIAIQLATKEYEEYIEKSNSLSTKSDEIGIEQYAISFQSYLLSEVHTPPPHTTSTAALSAQEITLHAPLKNPSTLCYANSLLQSLAQPEFISRLKQLNEIEIIPFRTTLIELLEKIISGKIDGLDALKSKLLTETKIVSGQQDPDELLSKIFVRANLADLGLRTVLSAINEEASVREEKEPDPSSHLHLPVAGSVQEMLSSIKRTSAIEQPKTELDTHHVELTTAPTVLFITPKRYSVERDIPQENRDEFIALTSGMYKDRRKIGLDRTISITLADDTKVTYELRAVAIHLSASKGSNAGHYKTAVKYKDAQGNPVWHEHNDGITSRIGSDEALNKRNAKEYLHNCYLLTYVRTEDPAPSL